MMPFQARPPLPDMSIFEEGDVILTFSGAVEAWGIAFCSGRYSDSNPLPCSHAEAIYRDKRQRLMLAGVSNSRVRTRPLKKALPEFQHLLVYRAQHPLAERRRAAQVLEQWMHDPQIRSAAFDYTLQDIPGRRNAFCCVGFLNEAFREAELEAPFIQTPWHPNAVARHLEALLDFHFETLITVDSIQENPAYEKISTWHNESIDPELTFLQQQIAWQGFKWYESGWRLKTSNQFNIILVLSAWPDSVQRTVRTQSQLRLFTHDVIKTWNRLKRRGKLKGLDHEQQQQLVQTICEKYRDRYFYRVDPDTHDNGLSKPSHTLTP
jgi:hypothetical protein